MSWFQEAARNEQSNNPLSATISKKDVYHRDTFQILWFAESVGAVAVLPQACTWPLSDHVIARAISKTLYIITHKSFLRSDKYYLCSWFNPKRISFEIPEKFRGFKFCYLLSVHLPENSGMESNALQKALYLLSRTVICELIPSSAMYTLPWAHSSWKILR
jgi:hypothetical protein